GGWIARFRIGYVGATLDTTIATLASQTSFTLTSGPAEDDALNGCEVIIHDAASAVQYTRAIVEDYTGSTKTVTLRALPAVTFTIAAKDNISVMGLRQVDVTHWKGAAAPAMTGDAFARLGAPVGASISADIAAAKANLVTLLAQMGAITGSGINTVLGYFRAVVAKAASLTPTDLSGSTTFDNTTDSLEANRDNVGAAGAGLTALGDTRVANLDATVSSRLASASYTAPPSAASNADAVWDEVLSGHLGAGSTGEALNAAGSAGDPWVTTLPGAYSAGQAGKIVGDNLNATVSSVKAKTDNLPSDPADASDVAASFATVNSTLATISGYLDTEIAAILAAVDTEVAAIKAKTDNLPADPADASDVAAQIAALNNLSAAQVNAEVLDVLATDTAAELGAVPAANASLKAKITFLAMLARNKLTQTSTTSKMFADDGTTQVAAATVSDDGTTYTRGELA
ncbi:MAG: hypothetical protein IT477_11675, partial [Rhodanobacteraceae bacterium]|nr:hypothetical protein [Rhodanobacteraceae bacterium]